MVLFGYSITWALSLEQSVALATLVNGGIVTYFGFQQHLGSVAQRNLEDAKHRASLFDRRFAVFQATQRVLSKVLTHAAIEYEDVHDFTVWTQQAYFLFDDEIYNYTLEIRTQLIKLASTKVQLAGPSESINRQELLESQQAALMWLIDQLDVKNDGIFSRFKKYLRH